MIIQCAIDPNDVTFRKVLETAARIRRPEDVVHVVHVFPRPLEWYRDPGNPLEQQTRPDRERLRLRIQAQLQGLDAKVSVPLGNGNAGEDLVAIAEKKAADLIVIGTHGRTGLSALTLGSVAERVVRLAGCDVYVVRM